MRERKRHGCHKVNVYLANCRNWFKKKRNIFKIVDAVVIVVVVDNHVAVDIIDGDAV